jgi:hypothetical protein
METGLKLLLRDGAIHVYFHPRLTVAQYAELTELTEKFTTVKDLSAAIEEAGKRWGVEVIID